MGDVFNQGIHQMLSPGVCIMTLNVRVLGDLIAALLLLFISGYLNMAAT